MKSKPPLRKYNYTYLLSYLCQNKLVTLKLFNDANVVAGYAALGSACSNFYLQGATSVADGSSDKGSTNVPTSDPIFAAAEVGQGHDGTIAGIRNYRNSSCASGGNFEIIDVARSHL